ncbi:P-loop containing nucleoside triphosphate hydrolases superfamily protein [Striga hermonthica]|uniref:P-loop containing nucleoside triphosphate hydrolases superfamily protein n=1 Tax=Striga hermonthica TaxID=68872 RepID=A0A9N7MSA2_STRHE|nr:P-loop containing nucleoside triphosphate hydrolases superfamily protein [Striga hermonthica]
MEGSLRRGGVGGMMSKPQTPRSSNKTARDLRSSEGSFSGKHDKDKDKGVNVQVVVRCRPLTEDETKLRTPVVISCNESRREVCAIQNIANKQMDRTFTFDKVFGLSSQQKDLYDEAVCPLVFEVIEGYNCTIFAYGQTGTGKTYTMEGGARKKNGEFPSDAGVIPRAVRQIFDILEGQTSEYNMKVSFLELYNEDITDLLAPEEFSRSKLALMEDGKGGVVIRGLEEEIVTSANEIYKILEKGLGKRRTAETLLNKQSSRSHSVFTITIHIKESTPEGEELIKCGKLNLVDLAGSENVSRSGAREGRAREAGEINKSLLTLGRCINTLVEHSGHIPFRDSKLTRLLRDSLGGKTKTCIIATISPSIHCLEETLSTLDYAHRAKNIKNKPEINQKMMKSAVIKDLYFEIDRLKQELFAAREKNGIYIPRDRYLQEEIEKKAMTEKIERIDIELESRDKHLQEVQELYNSQHHLYVELTLKLENTKERLQETQDSLLDLEERCRKANATIKEKEYLISNLLKSEKALADRALELRAELETAASDISNLFTKIDRKEKIEDGNRALLQSFQSQLDQQMDILHKFVASSTTQQEQQLKEMEKDMHLFVSTKTEATKELRICLENMKTMYGTGIRDLDDLAKELDITSQSAFSHLDHEVSHHSSSLEELFMGLTLEADILLRDLQENLICQENKLTAYAAQQRAAHTKAIESTQSIAQITIDLFKNLSEHVSKVDEIMKEEQTTNEYKLSELEKKFEECTALEERKLLATLAELVADSNARKKKLVECEIGRIRESMAIRTKKLQQEMSIMQGTTSSVKAKWIDYTKGAESRYLEDATSVESGKEDIKLVLHKCLEQVKDGAQQWNKAQESLLSLEKKSVGSVDEIVREAKDKLQVLRGQLWSTVNSIEEDVDTENKKLISSMNSSLQLDHEACEKLESIISPCRGDLRDLDNAHHRKIVEITENAGKCLIQDYKVDQQSCSTPPKRSINLPTTLSIEILKTQSFEELLGSFHSEKSPRQPNGKAEHVIENNLTYLTDVN